jgi:Ca-activated chloride channel family protein
MKRDLERFGDKLTPDEERRIWAKMRGALREGKSRGPAWRPRPWLTTATVAAAAALLVVAIWQADLLKPHRVIEGGVGREMAAHAPTAEAPEGAGTTGAPAANADGRAELGGTAKGAGTEPEARVAEPGEPAAVTESQKPAGTAKETREADAAREGTASKPDVASEGVTAIVPKDMRVYGEAEKGEAAPAEAGTAPLAAEEREAQAPARALKRSAGMDNIAKAEMAATAGAAADTSKRSESDDYGEIRGRVVNASGAPLPYAGVTVVGTRYGTVADANGDFVFNRMPAGTYTVMVSYMGYETLVIPDVVVEKEKSVDLMALSLEQIVVGTTDTLLVAEDAVKHEVMRSTTRASADTRNMRGGRSGEVQHMMSPEGQSHEVQKLYRPKSFNPLSPPPYPSLTGGQRPVNDELADDMFFRHYGTNPFIEADEDALSTFALDVDTGSYTICRRYINEGHLPPPEAVRVEEFVNSFKKNYTPPREDDFSIHVDGMPSPFAHVKDGRYRLLRIGIRGRVVDQRDRTPAQVVLVIDTSGSMDMGNRLPLLKESLMVLLDELRPDDEIGIVEFGSRARAVLPLTPVHEGGDVRRAIDRLYADGSTNAEHGLELGYEMMRRGARRGWIHRIIFCSDGVANVGNTGWESILESVKRDSDDIMLSTIGFGMGNYNDILMERLADAGDGQYSYVDNLSEAKRVLRENITGTLQTIARDTKAQIEFDPTYVDKYRLLGYENRDVRDEDFRNDDVDAGELGAGHEVTVLYEVELKDVSPRAHVATVRLRYERPEGGGVIELEGYVSGEDLARKVRDAAPDLVVDACVAEFAEILRGSYWAKDGSLRDVLDLLRDAERERRPSAEVRELEDLVRKAISLEDYRDEHRRGGYYEDRRMDRDE